MITRDRLAGLGATLLILLLVVGTPLLLIALGTTPWNESLGDLGTLLTSPDDGTLALLVISVVAWVAWAVMAVSVIVEILAALRRAPAPRLPGLALAQGLAGHLVAMAALLFTAAPTVAPAFAPQPVHAASVVEAPHTVSLPEPTPQASVEAMAESVATTESKAPTVEYMVRRGESLWKIAEEHLGDGMRFREIVALNEDTLHGQPNFIDPGLLLRLPVDAARAVDRAEKSLVGETYIVEPGDTLWDIANEELGEGERYPEIFEASRVTGQPDGLHLVDPDLIRPGWELTVPNAIDDSPMGEPPAVDLPVAPPNDEPLSPDTTQSTPPAETPAITPQPTTDPTADSPTGSRSDEAADGEDASATWLLPGLTGAGALLAGSVLVAVRAHRRTQQRSRRPGYALASPPPEVRAVEKTATVVGTPAAEVINQLDRMLRHLASTAVTSPRVNAVDVSNQTVTLHLAEPADLPEPWIGTASKWSADLNSPVGDEDVLPPYPLLASVGQGEDGHLWLLDFERLGAVTLTGDVDRATALARHLAAELTLSPWAVLSQVDTIGLAPELAELDALRLHHHHASDTEFLNRLQHDLSQALARGHGDPEPYIALLVAADRGDDVRSLSDLVQRQTSRSGFVVITIGDAEPGDVVIELSTAERVRVPSLGLDLIAAGLSAEEAAATAAIVDLTRDATVVPMPRETGLDGWRALADRAGALIPDLTDARPSGEAGGDSLLPEATERYETVAATTAEDVETLASVVPEQSRRAVKECDPRLDEDLAEWRDPSSALPKLQLLGPVTVAAPGDPPTAVSERRAYFNELVTFLALHPAGVSSGQVREAFGMTQSRARTDLAYVRAWFGTNPRTGELHLPRATSSPARKDRGAKGYQLSDVLVDLDLFRRLRARGQARGAEGMDDLVEALALVAGEPFSALRNPGWGWLLDEERIHETAIFAVVDVAHIVATDAFSRGDLDRARLAAETGCLAAPYDEVCRLDLAKVAEAEGHDTLAENILDEHVFNRTDDHLPPIDLPERTAQVLANGHRWSAAKRHQLK